MALTDKLTAIADEVRELSGTSETLTLDDMASSIGEVNSEIGTQSDLLDQVVVALEDKASGGSGEWIGDGNTHIWISLSDGRTNPMLGVKLKGTMTVDWGDGTEPDVLTSTNLSSLLYTPVHEYAKAGNYMITLSVDGQFKFEGSLANNSTVLVCNNGASDLLSTVYRGGSIIKIEIGQNASIGTYAFSQCYSLLDFDIPDEATIGSNAFQYCSSINTVKIPSNTTSIEDNVFSQCYSLCSIEIPNTVTSIGRYAFYNCYNLRKINLPESLTSIAADAFNGCRKLKSVVIPNNVVSIGSYAFRYCANICNIKLYNGSVTIDNNAFAECYGLRLFDCTDCKEIPNITATNVFSKTPADLEIRVPAALYDEWIAATNWSTYASKIVAV